MKLKILYILFFYKLTFTSLAQSSSDDLPLEDVQRYAILLGNQNYETPNFKLNNIYNDLSDTQQALESIGFTTKIFGRNLSTPTFRELIKSF